MRLTRIRFFAFICVLLCSPAFLPGILRAAPPAAAAFFSRFPPDDEIAHSRYLPGPILPLPVGPRASARAENRAIADALVDYTRRHDPEDVRPLVGFLDAYPGSRYTASLLTNLGALYKQQGRVTRAFPALARAWELSRNGTDENSMALANWALGEAAEMHAHLDPVTRRKLDTILDRLGSRDLHGPTPEKVRLAFAGRAMREQHPEEAYRCGPMSLGMLRAYLGLPRDLSIEQAAGSGQGFSLAALEQLANGHGMRMRAVHVNGGASLPVPAVIHWKYDHYSAILERREAGGREYFRIQNPLLDRDHWMSREAIEEESSGYYLVGEDQIGSEWRRVGADEAGRVWGRCEFIQPALDQLMDWSLQALCGGPAAGMPRYNFDLAVASLTITDIPLGYTPPVGPPVQFRITYHQRDTFQPAIFTYSNLGPLWTFNWFSSVGGIDTSATSYLGSLGAQGRVYLRNGGVEEYTKPNGAIVAPNLTTEDFGYQFQSHSRLLFNMPRQTTGGGQPPPDYYERDKPDGSKEIFGTQINMSGARVYLLTQVVDPQGNSIKFTYDGQMRMTAVTDAIGQVTTITYGLTGDPLKITKVTDPFGRSATIAYDSQGRLTQVVDVGGITSSFTYGPHDFITSMTTPYGTTTFQTGPGSTDTTQDPSYLLNAARYPNAASDPMNVFISATDPNGDTERAEFCNYVSALPQQDAWNTSLNTGTSGPPVPFLNTRLSFYWDKKVWKQYGQDYTKAKAYRWLDAQFLGIQSGVPDYIKNPLEGRIVFHYPNQTKPFYQMGTTNVPNAVMRLAEDGQTQQIASITSNDFGNVTSYTDPGGRQTTLLYDSNEIDLLEVRNGGTHDLLARFSYNSQHLPVSYTDTSGQITTYTYNSAGQILSVTDAKQQTTRYTYNARGYLTQVTGPLPSATASFTYDTFGRVASVTDSLGYTISYTYDVMDRITKVTYPDKTTEQVAYDKLDPVAFTDRVGRVTQTAYDVLRRPVSITDPLGQITTLVWCACGALVSMTDPAGI
jgi:YD repeat-containing protein